MTDEELVLLAQEEMNSDAINILLEKYEGYVATLSKSFYLQGAEAEDLKQEARVALFQAIMQYDRDMNASFSTYAYLCVNRRLMRVVEQYAGRKHSFLNEFISFYSDNDADVEGLEYQIESNHNNPEDEIVAAETAKYLKQQINDRFSNFEKDVFALMVHGYDYKQIASKLDKTPKAIDNAMQRIRKKMKLFFDGE